MGLIISFFLISLVLGQMPSLFSIFTVPVFVHDIFLFLLLTAAGVKIIKKGTFIHPRLSKPLIIFIIAAIVSLIINVNHVSNSQIIYGLLYFGRFIAYALVYIVVVQKRVPVKVWLRGLYVFGVLLAILGLLQFALYPSLANLRYLGWDPYYYRLFSTLFDPNFTGLILALTIFLGFSFARPGLAKLNILQAVILVALFLTFSRSAYLSFFAGLLVYGYLTKGWRLALGFVLVVLIFTAIPKPGLEAFRLTREISSVARLNNWQQSFNLFLTSPIFGHGFNLLKTASSGYLPSRAGAGVDNSFLFILDTTGLLGLLTIIYLVKKLIKSTGQLPKKSRETFRVVFITSLAAITIHSLFNNSLFYPWVMIWFWVLAGVAELKAGK